MPEPPLTEYYDVIERKGRWEFRCKRCREGWSLPISDNPHPGNLLTMLNHAKSHDTPAPSPEED